MRTRRGGGNPADTPTRRAPGSRIRPRARGAARVPVLRRRQATAREPYDRGVRMTPRLNNSRPAFTLVEILVVVVILGIAAAIIVPQMSSRDDLRVEGARRMLMADLIYAQNRSITSQVRHFVVFETGTNPRRYRIVTGVSTANPNGSP